MGSAVGLPATPNSLVFDRQGAKAYMGTDFSFFGSRGLMQITVASPPTVTQFKSVTGKVLTVSPDGKKVILSGADPNAVPVPGSNTPPPATQVIVFDTTSSTGTTLTLRAPPRRIFRRTVLGLSSPPAQICMCVRHRMR